MFSDRENKIIKIIGRSKLSIKEIEKQLFPEDEHKPFFSEISIGNSIRNIVAKCNHHKLEWSLVKNKSDNKFLFSKGKV